MDTEKSSAVQEWGPEIRVDGVRPEWLDGPFLYTGNRSDGYWYGPVVGYSGWSVVRAIRLPANHPHYATPPRGTAADQLERMEAITRKLAARANGDGTVNLYLIREAVEEAVEVAALLPEPVDPDLVEAKRLLSEAYANAPYGDGGGIEFGWDEAEAEALALAAIKRGRELAGEGK